MNDVKALSLASFRCLFVNFEQISPFLAGILCRAFCISEDMGKNDEIRFINPYRFKHFNYLKTVLKYGRKNITKHKKGAKKIT